MEFDIVIAGGGPAGLSTALTAAQAGARVALFEKSKEIGSPIRTSGGSWIDALQALDIPDTFMSPVYEGVFVGPSHTATVKYDKPQSCVLDIRGLYQYLAEIAAQAGARLFVDTTVDAPLFVDDKVSGVVVHRGGTRRSVQAHLVVDATGVNCTIARRAGLTTGFRRQGIGVEYDLYAPNWPSGRVALLFGSQVAPAGYGWLFPHGQKRLRAGVGVLTPDTGIDPRPLLDRLLSGQVGFEQDLRGISRIEYHTGVVPGEPYDGPAVADGLLLVGDAGGQLSLLLGEGIRYAIDIGRMAGRIAGEAVRKERYDRKFLREFDRVWRRKYQRSFRIGALLNRRLAAYSDEQWDEKIKTLDSLAPPVVAELLRGNFTSRFLLKVAANYPDLFRKSLIARLKALVKSA